MERQMRDVATLEPVTGKISAVARMTGVSPSTIRRRLKDDPEFPKPFRLSDEGDLLWPLAEVRTYLERKAGRPLAA
jgi:predicted DNA-binding transcriptional regulator AlpA